MKRRAFLISAATAVVIFASGMAAAAQTTSVDLLTEVQRCRSISSPDDRLACFDRTSANLSHARDAGEVVVVNKEKMAAERRRRFGLGPAAPVGGADVPGVEVKELASTIRSVASASIPLRFNIELANASVWQTVETARGLKVGAAITIRRASLGGYRASIANGRSFLVKRIR